MPFSDPQRSKLNKNMVAETTDCLVRVLRAACEKKADTAVAKENYRLTEEIQTLQALGSVLAVEGRDRAGEQAATKRVFEVVHEMYNKEHESN